MTLQFDGIRHAKKRAFLVAYARCGIIATACRYAEIDRQTYYNWSEHDGQFAAAAKLAYSEAGDYIEEAALQRATIPSQTTIREVYEGGKLVRREVTQGVSDTMLAMMLNGAKPEKYKHRSEVTIGEPGVKTVAREFYEAL